MKRWEMCELPIEALLHCDHKDKLLTLEGSQVCCQDRKVRSQRCLNMVKQCDGPSQIKEKFVQLIK